MSRHPAQLTFCSVGTGSKEYIRKNQETQPQKYSMCVYAQAGADKDAEIYWILSRLGSGDFA
jgi:hypothetical protein